MPPWKKVKLGDVCEIRRGASPRPIQDFLIDKSGVPWVKISDATASQSRYIERTKEFVMKDGADKSVRVYPGDLILSNSATPGMPKILKIEACIHDGWLLLRNFKGINKEFLYYFFIQNREILVNKSNGSVFNNLKTEIVKEFKVDLPDLPTQSRIASILSAFDDKIELNRQMNNTLEQIAQALYKKYFVAGIDPDNLPEGWRWGKVRDIFNISIGRTPPRNQHEWFTSDSQDIKWISIKDMGNISPFIIESSEYLTEGAVSKFNIPVIPIDTVVLSFKLTMGRVSITTENMLSNEAIAHFISKHDSYLSKEFTFLYLKNFDYNSLGNTSSIATAVNSQTIKEMDFLIPDKISIGSFNNSVTLIFSKILQSTFEIKLLEQTRNILLPKLMNGEIPVDSLSLIETQKTIVA